jgi:succinoglycan biosynthesis protein ExoA
LLGGKRPSQQRKSAASKIFPPARFPLVSVLLAARNEEASINACLVALAHQDYPPDLIELVVADADSEDATATTVDRFAACAPFTVKAVRNPRRTAAAGFNTALRHARGAVIVILGARARPEPGFVAACVAALRASGADAVGGVVRGCGEGLQGRVNALALGSRFGVGGARYRYGGRAGEVDTVNYGAYRRDVFARIGGFDETMTNVEDDEFNYRLRANGGRLTLSPEIRCEYYVRPTLSGLARQFVRYGYPKVRVLRRHPQQMQPRQFAPAAFVSVLLCAAAVAPRLRAGRLLLALAGGAYLAASLAISFRLARRHGWRTLPLLPVAFVGMHLGYGIASLAGSVRFLLWPALARRREQPEIPCFSDEWLRASPCEPI